MVGSAAASSARVTLSVIGNIEVSVDTVAVPIASQKGRALIAYLALSNQLQETRERLVGIFWSESDESKARASLRQTLRDIRQAFRAVNFDGFETNRLMVSFSPGSVSTDLGQVLDALRTKRQAHQLLLNTPALSELILAGLEDLDASFRYWLLTKRQGYHEQLLRALEQVLADPTTGPAGKLSIAAGILNLDPTHEDACRLVMEGRASAGDIAGALRVYNRLWELLDREYDMEPTAATQSLVAKIKSGGFDGGDPITIAPTAQATPKLTAMATDIVMRPDSPARIRLVVDRFGLNGVIDGQAHLVHGFRHHLIASLVRFREWSVIDGIATGSADAEAPPGPSYVVEATGYAVRDIISLVLTLKERSENVYHWSERFDLSLETWFEAQQSIVKRVAVALRVSLSAQRLAQLSRRPDISLDVYDRWLRGQALISTFTPANWSRGAQLFRETVRDAPYFSSGYSSLVQTNNISHIVHPGVFRDQEKAEETIELAQMAVQLDPLDSRAHLALSWSYVMARRYVQGELQVDVALSINDHDPWTTISAAQILAFCGKHERAVALADQALMLAPAPTTTHWAYEATLRFLTGEYARSVESAERAGGTIITSRAWKTAALSHLGETTLARSTGQALMELVRGRWSGRSSPTDDTVTRWILSLFPIKRREDWERFRDGLGLAGLPVNDAAHEVW
ncbi:MAG: hypothetical protein K2X57_06640 [Xanthobacteraceae bacterium]|nr:hypothetical protein [Xanthobacteraceae bacterium]